MKKIALSLVVFLINCQLSYAIIPLNDYSQEEIKKYCQEIKKEQKTNKQKFYSASNKDLSEKYYTEQKIRMNQDAYKICNVLNYKEENYLLTQVIFESPITNLIENIETTISELSLDPNAVLDQEKGYSIFDLIVLRHLDENATDYKQIEEFVSKFNAKPSVALAKELRERQESDLADLLYDVCLQKEN